MAKFHLTQAGLLRLQEELEELKRRRPGIIEAIASARAQGDLSENSEYQTAKEEQALLDNRISNVEDILRNHEIISGQHKTLQVVLGSKVYLKHGRDKKMFEIVGTIEADPLNGLISDDSAIGQNLIGKAVGAEIMLPIPGGQQLYKITSIE